MEELGDYERIPSRLTGTHLSLTHNSRGKQDDKRYTGHGINLLAVFVVCGNSITMSLLMDSADLYLTKPEGISVTEAALKNLPMVLIDAVAGCEEFNRIFYVRHGGAKTGENNQELTKLTLELLTKQEQIDKMRNRLSELPKENASALIYYQMNELLEKKQNEHDLKEQQEAQAT